MYIHHSHLPQLLPPSAYHSREQFEIELQRLFMPAWHCIGSVNDLPKDGDYFTRDLLGHPLLVWNKSGEIRAFLNVCSHRHCKLTERACGKTLPHLRCQLHGWEYDETGKTRHIPDAKSFRPLTSGTVGLKKFATATCGQLIFVSLSENPPELSEYLGPAHPVCIDAMGDNWKPTLSVEVETEANWKLLMENVLEDYHIAEVHKKTFRNYSKEEICRHELFENGSILIEQFGGDHSSLSRLAKLPYKILKVEPDYGIYHVHCFPNLVVAKMGLFSWLQIALPISPTKTLHLWRFFHYRGNSNLITNSILSFLMGFWGKRFFQKVLNEDYPVLCSSQKGFNSPLHPTGGLISTREERIFHFQEYLLKETGVTPVSPSQHESIDETIIKQKT